MKKASKSNKTESSDRNEKTRPNRLLVKEDWRSEEKWRAFNSGSLGSTKMCKRSIKKSRDTCWEVWGW